MNLVLARSLTSRNERIDFETENFLVGALQARDFKGVGNQYVNEGKLVTSLKAGDGPHGRAGIRMDDPLLPQAEGVRRLTPLECERLMGWPDEHTRWAVDGKEIPDSHRYRMCGNGVVAPVAEWIGHRIVEADRLMRAA